MSDSEEKQHLKELLQTVSRFDDGLALTLGGITGRLYSRVEELEGELDRANFGLGLKTAENQRYKQALEFYTDEENYKPFDGIFLSRYQNKVDEDGGKTAREALKGES